VLDQDGKYIKVIETKFNDFLIPPDEIRGKYLHDLFNAELADVLVMHIQKALREKETQNIEYQIQAYGKDIWYSASISPISSDQVMSVSRDITIQKIMQERFRNLLEALPVSVVVTHTQNGTIKYANEAYKKLMKVPPEGVIGKTVIHTYSNPADRQKLLRKVKKDGYIQNREIEIKTWQDDPLWTMYSIQPISWEGESALLSVLNDITENKKIQNARVQSETSFRGLFESAPVAIILVDEDGIITLANDFTEGMFGYSRTELIGQSLQILVPHSQRTRHLSHMEKYFETPLPLNGAKRMGIKALHKN
jgi:PAS domain S-box-containing protein